MAFTDVEVKKAKPREKLYKLPDGGGLQLWVFPDGAKRWRFSDSLSDALAARRATARRNAAAKEVWYWRQKEHWLGWLADYDGPGAYGRKAHSGRSAAFVYNHVMNPAMVFWLGEGAGVQRELVEQAAAACLAAGSTLPKECAAIRAVIPWEMIEERLQRRKPAAAKAAKPARPTPPGPRRGKAVN